MFGSFCISNLFSMWNFSDIKFCSLTCSRFRHDEHVSRYGNIDVFASISRFAAYWLLLLAGVKTVFFGLSYVVVVVFGDTGGINVLVFHKILWPMTPLRTSAQPMNFNTQHNIDDIFFVVLFFAVLVFYFRTLSHSIGRPWHFRSGFA